ncbi:all trans-polyprenyl-diphosphate synthase PDSS1-like [Ciona intestinalis]
MKLIFDACLLTRPSIRNRVFQPTMFNFLFRPENYFKVEHRSLHLTCRCVTDTIKQNKCWYMQRTRDLHCSNYLYAKDASLPHGFDSHGFDDMSHLHFDIKKILHTNVKPLQTMCSYYFDGNGKHFRPKVVSLVSKLCNEHGGIESKVSESQRKISLIAEMIHVGSLIHDDVVDFSNVRRGKRSVNALCGDHNAVMVGNYVVANASKLLASIGNPEITIIISQIIDDIVRGEFMQQDNKDQFKHYLKKTYKKTASLIANCCKAVASLSSNNNEVIEAAYQYGSNIGMAFQLVDDLLDFVASSKTLGKPSVADLKLGLATAPVLFACDKHPDLHSLILRRFNETGDVEWALEAVYNSSALEETRLLAEQYCKDARLALSMFHESTNKTALLQLTDVVLNRCK